MFDTFTMAKFPDNNGFPVSTEMADVTGTSFSRRRRGVNMKKVELLRIARDSNITNMKANIDNSALAHISDIED